jgi:hypothetical protein
MEGFTESKMPDDYLISALSKEISRARQILNTVVDKRYETRKISIYCVNLDY